MSLNSHASRDSLADLEGEGSFEQQCWLDEGGLRVWCSRFSEEGGESLRAC